MNYLDFHKNDKFKIVPTVDLKHDNLHVYYTPGVSQPCMAISENVDNVYTYSWKKNSVAVISDGSRVLGLGDIGPKASMPLLEGKALLFNSFAKVNAVPIAISKMDARSSVDTIKNIAHGFGAINLEDISSPRCYDILDALIEELDVPVFHDDQQGTATVILASLINSLKLVEKNIGEVKILLYGMGAANTAVYRLLKLAGAKDQNIIGFDSKGVISKNRTDLFKVKILKHIAQNTNPDNLTYEEAFKNADVLISLSKPGPGTIDLKYVKQMSNNAICFICANPEPEIKIPELSKLDNVKIIATGRSDFPNQANNAIIFPGLFRGILDARASKITWQMCIDVANDVASLAQNDGLSNNYIVPKIDHPLLHKTVSNSAIKSAFKYKLTNLNNFEQILEISNKIINS